MKVQMILLGPVNDAEVVRTASRASWGRLLQAGAEIYEYQPTLFHCKVMVVDEVWTSVGSTNFDNRSFSINDEANLNIYDRDFAREQIRVLMTTSRNPAALHCKIGRLVRGRKSSGRRRLHRYEPTLAAYSGASLSAAAAEFRQRRLVLLGTDA